MPFFDDDYDDQEDCSDEFGYDFSESKFAGDIRQTAVDCLEIFFQGKKYWAGGDIPKSKLFKEEYIKAVMEMTVMDSLALSYYCLTKNPPDTVNTSVKHWDIELCFECLKRCGSLKARGKCIPKCHAGGILLVYLSLCHGVEFLPVIKKLGEIRAMFAQREKEEELECEADDE